MVGFYCNISVFFDDSEFDGYLAICCQIYFLMKLRILQELSSYQWNNIKLYEMLINISNQSKEHCCKYRTILKCLIFVDESKFRL